MEHGVGGERVPTIPKRSKKPFLYFIIIPGVPEIDDPRVIEINAGRMGVYRICNSWEPLIDKGIGNLTRDVGPIVLAGEKL